MTYYTEKTTHDPMCPVPLGGDGQSDPGLFKKICCPCFVIPNFFKLLPVGLALIMFLLTFIGCGFTIFIPIVWLLIQDLNVAGDFHLGLPVRASEEKGAYAPMTPADKK